MRVISWLTLASFVGNLAVPALVPVAAGAEPSADPSGSSDAGLAAGVAPDEQAQAKEAMRAVCLERANLRVTPAKAEAPGAEPTYRLYALVAEKAGDPPLALDCAAFGVGPVAAKNHPELAPAAREVPCFDDGVRQGLDGLVQLQRDASYAAELLACSKSGTPLISASCAKEVSCNGLRGMTTLLTGGTIKMGLALYDQYQGAAKTAERGCLNFKNDDCVQKTVMGLLKGLWMNVEGLGYAGKMLWNGTKWVGEKSWSGVKWAGGKVSSWFSSDDVRAAEDKSAEAALAASNESESSIRKFLADPVAFVQEQSVRLFNSVGEYLKVNFHEAWASWKCASCDAVVNGVCEILGMLGAEVLLAFLTGGTVNAAAKSAKFAKVAEVAAKVAEAASKSRALREVGKGIGRLSKAVAYLPEKILKAAAKLPVVKQYVHVTEKAFLMGYQKGFAGSASALLAARGAVSAVSAEDALAASRSAITVEDAVVAARDAATAESGVVVEITDLASLNEKIGGPPPVSRALPAAKVSSTGAPLRDGMPSHSAEAGEVAAMGADISWLAVYGRPSRYLSLEELWKYDRVARAYTGAEGIPVLKFKKGKGGLIEINGGKTTLHGRPIEYEPSALAPVPHDLSAKRVLDSQFKGTQIEPLIGASGKPVKGGFQRVFITPPEVSQLGGTPSLLKVVDPAMARTFLGTKTTEAEVAKYVLKASQLDDTYYTYLERLALESGHPPAFVMPKRKRVSPMIVEVERMDAPTLSELKKSRSPLLQKCRDQLDRFIKTVGVVYVAMDVAYRKRYSADMNQLRSVTPGSASGKLSILPLGPDINHNNVKLTEDCVVQVIDQ